MKTITLNIPEPLHAKIIQEVSLAGFPSKTAFFQFVALNYFLNKKPTAETEDEMLIRHEDDILSSLSQYLKNPKNIAQVIQID